MRRNLSLRSSLLMNGLANGVQKVVRIGEQLLLVPFFLAAWSPSYYGEWLSITAIPAVLALSDLGLGTAAGNAFVLRFASGDIPGAERAAKTGFLVLFVAALAGILLGGPILAALAINGALGGGDMESKVAAVVLGMLMASRMLMMFTQLLDAFYRSARRAALSVHAVTACSACKIGVSFAVLKLGGQATAIACSDLIVSALYVVAYAAGAFRLLPNVRFWSASVTKREVRELLPAGVAYMASPAWQAILFQGTTIVVRVILGPESVVMFNTIRAVCRSVNQLFGLINSTIFPDLQYAIGLKDLQSARSLFRFGVMSALFAATVGGLGLYYLGPTAYAFWTRGKIVPPSDVWAIFLVGIVLNALWWTAGMVFRAANRPAGFTTTALVGASLSVLASYFLCGRYGVAGAAFGTLLVEVVMCWYCFKHAYRSLSSGNCSLIDDMIGDVRSIAMRLRRG